MEQGRSCEHLAHSSRYAKSHCNPKMMSFQSATRRRSRQLREARGIKPVGVNCFCPSTKEATLRPNRFDATRYLPAWRQPSLVRLRVAHVQRLRDERRNVHVIGADVGEH